MFGIKLLILYAVLDILQAAVIKSGDIADFFTDIKQTIIKNIHDVIKTQTDNNGNYIVDVSEAFYFIHNFVKYYVWCYSIDMIVNGKTPYNSIFDTLPQAFLLWLIAPVIATFISTIVTTSWGFLKKTLQNSKLKDSSFTPYRLFHNYRQIVSKACNEMFFTRKITQRNGSHIRTTPNRDKYKIIDPLTGNERTAPNIRSYYFLPLTMYLGYLVFSFFYPETCHICNNLFVPYFFEALNFLGNLIPLQKIGTMTGFYLNLWGYLLSAALLFTVIKDQLIILKFNIKMKARDH